MGETVNVFDLPRDEFNNYMLEMEWRGEDTSELRRQYGRKNSIFSGIYDWADQTQQDLADEDRRIVHGGFLSKERGTTGMDALRSARLEPSAFVSGLLGGVASGIDAPADAARGYIPPEDMVDRALDTAGMVALGGAATSPASLLRYDPNQLNMFLGRRSAGADLDALTEARELSARRRSAEEIWGQTGWFKGADGEWRYEIDDSNAVLKESASDTLNYGGSGYQTNYSGGLLHQPLLGGTYRDVNYPAAYGFMGDMDFAQAPMRSGSFDRDTGQINVRAPDAQEGLPVALHELQHAVQRQEGFASGSSPDFELSTLRNSKEQGLIDLFNRIRDTKRDLGLYGSGRGHPALQPLYERYDELRDRNLTYNDAYQQYLRAAGEVEANNVMNRRTMTPQERRDTPPWITQDFPYAEQIVRPQTGLLSMAVADDIRSLGGN